MSTPEVANVVNHSQSAETEQQMGKANDVARWSFTKRIIFRFVFSYLFIYIFPFPLDSIPFMEFFTQRYNDLWNAIAPWTGKHILRLSYDITVLPNGSGDTTYNYVQILCCFALAVAVTAIWTLFDRRRSDYEKLHQWLRVYVRFSLAQAMIGYGAFKIIDSQFPPPPLDRLLQPFGDASPMGLLWTFMGASQSYTAFAGCAEMLGGLLITVPRTATLGSLVSIAVLINIVMLNLCYDVPVKLYSIHLLAMAVFIVAPDLRRLSDLFLFNRRVEKADLPSLFKRKWLNYGAAALRIAFVACFVCLSLFQSYQGRSAYDSQLHKSLLQGVWSVDEFEIDGEIRPPDLADETRWQRVISDYPGMLGVQLMNGSRLRYNLKLDMEKKTLSLGKRDDPNWKADFSFTQSAPGLIALEGTLDNRPIRAKLRRTEAPKFLLTNRGFHWINEYPFNR